MADYDGLFLVLFDVDDHFLVVTNGIVDAFGSLLRHGDRGEDLLDFLLHLVDINIAHYDDGLQVGAIPLLIVVAQVLVREVIDNLHRADRQTVLIFRALIDLWHSLFL